MGVVYKALDPHLQRLVALKTMSADLAQDEAFKRRFYREARAAASLNHPNIVTIHELGEHEGSPFIAMEFLEGQGLDRIVRAGMPILLAKKLAIVRQVSVALDFAHRRGVVHRDVKPANIMLLPDGSVKVVDFGIARMSASTTQTDHVVGTLNYMSPEQVSGEPVDARSDIFSLGVVLYEFLCYRHPFAASNSLPAIIMKIAKEDPPPLQGFFPECPEDLAALVMRALAKQAQNRYPSMELVLVDLDPILARTSRETADQLCGNAQYYVDQKQWAAAGSCLEHVLDLDSARTDARALLDYVRAQLERESLRGQLDPRVETIREMLQSKRFLDAAAECEAILLIDKSNPQARELLIEARRALEVARLVQHHLDEAQRLLAEGFLAPAQAEVNKVLGLDPGHTQAQTLLAEIRSKSEERGRHRRLSEGLAQAREIIEEGDLHAAESRLAGIEREFPGDPEAAKLRGFVKKQLEQEELARWTRERIDRAQDLLSRGQYDRALEVLESARIRNPHDTGVIDLLARTQEEKARAEVTPPLEKTRIITSPMQPPRTPPEIKPPAPRPARVVMPPPRVQIPPAPAQPRRVEARAPAQPEAPRRLPGEASAQAGPPLGMPPQRPQEVAPPPPSARPMQVTVAQVARPGLPRPIKWLLAVVLLAGAIAGGYGLYQKTRAPASITGHVTDPTGAPLGGLKVTLQSEVGGQSWTAVTDAQGSYRFTGITPGQYTLQLEAPQGLETPKPAPIDAIASREQQRDIQLARKVGPNLLAALHGRFVDERGRPLRQFRVRFTNQESGSEAVVEGRNGDYEIQELRPGTYSLFAEAARGKRSPAQSVTLQPGETGRVDLALGAPETAPPTTGRGSLRVTVTDEAGKPLAGASVRVSGPKGSSRAGTTDASGNHVFREVSPGSYVAEVQALGYSPGSSPSVRLKGSEEETVSVSLHKLAVSPGPASTVTVAGKVVDNQGRGIRLATVYLVDPANGARKKTTTDSGGNFSYSNVKPGAYEISVEPSSFYQHPKSRPIKVTPGEPLTLPPIALSPAS